jgi:serine/threonine protein phosphatase PrpC
MRMDKNDPPAGARQKTSAPFSGLREFPPPPATVQVAFGAQSRRAKGRGANDDHYAVIEMGRHQETLLTSLPKGALPDRYDEYGYAMVVAGGIGAWGSGEFASRLAVTTLMHLVLHFGKWQLRVDESVAQDIMRRADRFYRQVDNAVGRHGLTSPSPSPQTAMTAIFGAGRDLFFAHVGHSRVYLSRDGSLMRLTRDHTVDARRSTRTPLAPLVDESAAARDLRHVLTDAIGMGGSIGPAIDIERIQIGNNDRVLVCTAGLTDAVDEKFIGDVLASDRLPDEQCRVLADAGAAAGGDDDVTALVAHFRFPAASGQD